MIINIGKWSNITIKNLNNIKFNKTLAQARGSESISTLNLISVKGFCF